MPPCVGPVLANGVTSMTMTGPRASAHGADALARRLAIYLVADPDQAPGDLVAMAELALGAGATAVQLRSKLLPDGPFLSLAERLLSRCRRAGALFVVNDRLDVALAVGADGLHLGTSDFPLPLARRLGGADLILGYSPETDRQAAEARSLGAHYVGVGPVFATASKDDAGAAIGLPTMRRRIAAAGLPSVGIGGITAANAGEVVANGADGVAVISAILRAADPADATRALAAAVTGALTGHRDA